MNAEGVSLRDAEDLGYEGCGLERVFGVDEVHFDKLDAAGR